MRAVEPRGVFGFAAGRDVVQMKRAIRGHGVSDSGTSGFACGRLQVEMQARQARCGNLPLAVLPHVTFMVVAVAGQPDEADARGVLGAEQHARSEEHTSELQSLMRISDAVFCLKK